MFNELTGKTLNREQLLDWSIAKGITGMTVEDIIYKALEARANITQLSKKYLEGMEERMYEKKITKEKLLELCRKYGTDKAAESKIAEETRCTVLTIKTYIGKWGIKPMLRAMEAKDKDIKGFLKGVKGMEEEPVLTCMIEEKPVMVVDDVALYRTDVKRLKEITTKHEEVKQGVTTPVAIKPVAKPTGKLKVKSLEGENFAYTVCEADRTVIISDLAARSDLEVPLDEFTAFAAEICNFNRNYLRRFM